MSAFYSQRRWGLIRETKLPLRELELKIQGEGGLYTRWGRNRGILRYYYCTISNCSCVAKLLELPCHVDTNNISYVVDVKLDSTVVHLDRIPLLW